MEKKKYHHGDLYNALLKEGRKLLAKDSYEHFSIRRLAKKIGVTPMAVYKHFENKEMLVGTIVDSAMERFSKTLKKSLEEIEDPKEILNKLSIGFIRFFIKNPEILSVLFLDLSGRNTLELSQKQNVSFELRSTRAYKILLEMAEPLSEIFEGLSLNEITLMIWSRVHGISVLVTQEKWLFKPEEMSDEKLLTILSSPY